MREPTLARTSISDLVIALAQRSPTPGGGAAAAIAAALGCAAGAMAARYTSGPKHAAHAAQAEALAKTLDSAARDCLLHADADAEAYAALSEARKRKDPPAIAAATAAAVKVPADLLAACSFHGEALARFLPLCNPHLVSDVQVGIHLLAGSARAAWQTLLVNAPDQLTRDAAKAHLAAVTSAERTALDGTLA